MGDISENFNRSEFACQCGCGQDTVDVVLLQLLEEIREWAGAPIKITSGNRCPTHNEKEGGAKRSQHLTGRGADIKVKGKTPFQVYRWMEDNYPLYYGCKAYSSWTHVDSRTGRWRG